MFSIANQENATELSTMRESLITATKLSREKRDRLHQDLMKTSGLEIKSKQSFGDVDDADEAESMFPAKSNSMLISIRKSYYQGIEQSNNIMTDIDSNFYRSQYEQRLACQTNIQENVQQKQLLKEKVKNDENPNDIYLTPQLGCVQTQETNNQVPQFSPLEENSTLRSEKPKQRELKVKIEKKNQSNGFGDIKYLIPQPCTNDTLDSQKTENDHNSSQDYGRNHNKIHLCSEIDENHIRKPSLSQGDSPSRTKRHIPKNEWIKQTDRQFNYVPFSDDKRQTNQTVIKFHQSFFFGNDTDNNDQSMSQIFHSSLNTSVQLMAHASAGEQESPLSGFAHKNKSKNDEPTKVGNCIRNSSPEIVPQANSNEKIQEEEEQQQQGVVSLSTFLNTKQNALLKGWIVKKSSNLFIGWQRRWLILKKGKLQYFKTEEATHHQGCLDFSLLQCTLTKVENIKGELVEIRISIQNSSKVFRFRQDKDNKGENLTSWAREIQEQIKICDILKETRPKHLTLQNKFWKEDRISLSEFQNLADTGDFALFQGKTFGEKILRNVLGCEYNHIGMILRTSNSDNNLIILEATGEEGVGLLSWKTFIKRNWQDLYYKISLRKLQVERTDCMLQKIESFIRYAIGKPYSISFSKLFGRNPEKDLIEDPNRTYFCSELIASVYKSCGLLPLDKSSASYWPGSFEGSRNLHLLNNASLSEEFMIDFSI